MRRPRGRTLWISAAVVVLAVLGVEFGVRALAERVATQELADAGVGSAQVTVGRAWWRPSVVPALLGGRLDRIQIELDDATVSSIPVRSASYRLDSLAVDISPLAATIDVESIGRGSFQLLVDPSGVGELLDVPAEISRGELMIGDDTQPAGLRVDGGELVISSEYLDEQGLDARLPVVDRRLLPCDPTVRISGFYIELSCEGDRLPGILDRPFQRSDQQDLSTAGPALEPPATLERDASEASSTTTTTDAPSSTTTTTTTTTVPSSPLVPPATLELDPGVVTQPADGGG